MNIYIVDNPQEMVMEQGGWIHYTVAELFVFRQTLEAHKEMYGECGVNTEPLDAILREISKREHPQ